MNVTNLFSKLAQISMRTNKLLDKCIYALWSSCSCHPSKEMITKVSRHPKLLNLVQTNDMFVGMQIILGDHIRPLMFKFFRSLQVIHLIKISTPLLILASKNCSKPTTKFASNVPYTKAMLSGWKLFYNCFSHPWILINHYSFWFFFH